LRALTRPRFDKPHWASTLRPGIIGRRAVHRLRRREWNILALTTHPIYQGPRKLQWRDGTIDVAL